MKKSQGDHSGQEIINVKEFQADAAAKAAAEGKEDEYANMTEEEIRDKISQEKWTKPAADNVTPEFSDKFIKSASFGSLSADSTGPVRDGLYFLSGVNWFKVFLVFFVFFNIWVFLLVLSIMGTGFKLLG